MIRDDRVVHDAELATPGAERDRGPLLTAWSATRAAELLDRASLPLPPGALPGPVIGEPAWRQADRATMEAIRARAEAEHGTAWPQPLASQYSRFFRDGNRTAYESQVAARQERLTRAVVLAAATDDPAWLDEAADGIWLLCEQSSWCWAAHDTHVRQSGTALPDVHAPYLDLGAGEVAAQLAWADHVLGPVLDTRYPGLRERVRHEVRQRIVEPFLGRRDWPWLGLDGDVHNWCPWICGNVLVAALQLIPDGDERVAAVAWAIESIDRFLAALPPDGSVDEGYEYWWNGACRALEALDVVAHATAGALDASQVPVVRATVAFPHRMHLGGDWYLNVADARARPPRDQPWAVLHRWSRHVGDHDAAAHAASYRVPGEPVATARHGLGRLLGALCDPQWTAATTSRPPLVGSAWCPGVQVALARERPGTTTGLTLAVKGGHNGEHHNHNDVGSVVVAVDGVPVVVDAGRPTYTAQTFGPDRYAIWTMHSDWHNVPKVRGTPQGQGRRFHARRCAVSREPDRFVARVDLGSAYPVPGLEWRRDASLDTRASRVTIEDAWTLAPSPTGGAAEVEPTTLHYLLAGEVHMPCPGRVIVWPLDGARATQLTWNPDRAAGSLTGRILDDPMLTDVWGSHLTRLELRIPDDEPGNIALTTEVLG
ncbi:heparinase II/III domain-containing protein [Phytoactinopolyspora halophila]|uniref:heparinase II/III domain-containing protein n=1 Tax=Phytoactinopolyspora halophila TaxID=1981511 RepID=UPI00131491FC|nr:heparinase II/III family protein [Phytoactinopolyspora halophila]